MILFVLIVTLMIACYVLWNFVDEATGNDVIIWVIIMVMILSFTAISYYKTNEHIDRLEALINEQNN